MSDWKEKTCEKCEFNIDLDCRRFPPLVNGHFPYIGKRTKACAEFKEKGEEK